MPLIRIVEYVVNCDGGTREIRCDQFSFHSMDRQEAERSARDGNWLNIGRRWYCPKCAATIAAKRPELDTRNSAK